MNLYDAIRVKALLTVYEGNSPEYIERHLHRWYSQTFHTPLSEVQDIPLTIILTHLFETEFESLSPNKRLKEMNKILNGDEELNEFEKQDVEDENYIKKLKEDMAKEKLKAPTASKPDPKKIGTSGPSKDSIKRFASMSKTPIKK